MNMLLLILSLGLFLFISLQLNRYIRYRQWLDWFLGGFLIWMALVILVMTLSGLVYRMNSLWFVLGLEALLAVLAYLFTHFVRTPACALFPFPFPKINLKEEKLSFPVLIFFLVSAGVALLNLIYVLCVPPNNNDSLAIHLARVGMWLQTGSWLPWNTKVFWQLTFPMNAELISYWTVLFTRGEHLLGLPAYVSGYLSAVVIYLLGKELTSKKSLALLAALTWAAFPVVQLNFTSTRHDHVSSFLLLATVYFFIQHLKEKNTGYVILSGLAIGLSIGTNYSVGGYLPGLAIFFLLCCLVFKKINWQEFVILGAASLLAFFLFSSPVFISNRVHFGSFLGPDAPRSGSLLLQSELQENTSAVEHTILMAGRWAYQIIDFEGTPEPFFTKLMQMKAWLPNRIASITGFSLEVDRSQLNQHVFRYKEILPLSEDSSWFGLMGMFVFFIVSIFILWATLRRKSPLLILTSLFLLTVPLSYSFLRSAWTPYDGRYFITLFAMLSIGLVLPLERVKPRQRYILIAVITLLSFFTLFMSIYANPAKSFWGYKAFWKQHRFDSISAQSYDTKEMIYLVDQTVPENGVLGIATQGLVYYEYGLFGEHFTRRIVPIYPADLVCDPEWLADQQIQYILVDYGDPDYPPCSLGAYESLKSMKNWMVFKIQYPSNTLGRMFER